MMPDWFHTLTCPDSGARLRPEPLEQDGMALLHGPKHVYPVLHGIPRLILDETRAVLVARLRSGDWEAATAIALSWPDKNLGNRIRRKASKALLKGLPGLTIAHHAAAALSTGKPLLHPHHSTQDLLEELQSGFFIDWLIHRFSARTFKPLRALARVLRPADQVLDIGGGFGHGAWEVSAHVVPEQITLVDNVFSHLYLAKTRMVPGIRAVAADVNLGVPFEGCAFDAIVMSDTFHFVDAQDVLAGETLRLLAPKGRLILSQLHNGLIEAEFSGNPRSPAGYVRLFGDLETRLVRNRDILAAMAAGRPLKLSTETDAASLEVEAELSLIADRNGTVLADYPDPQLVPRNPALSSLLEPVKGGGLQPRDTINDVIRPFLDFPDPDLLARLKLADVLEAIAHKDCERLIRAGIVVDVPHGYFS